MQAIQLDLFSATQAGKNVKTKRNSPKREKCETLSEKVSRAISLLRTISASSQTPVEVSYSGGKDSDVILELCRMAGIRYHAVYKNTTIDPPGTISHCVDKQVEIIRRNLPSTICLVI